MWDVLEEIAFSEHSKGLGKKEALPLHDHVSKDGAREVVLPSYISC